MDTSAFSSPRLPLGQSSLLTAPAIMAGTERAGNLLEDCDLVVFSHLRWEFVIQRPQHIISRLAKGRRVLFVEEPVAAPQGVSDTARVLHPTRQVTVLQPYATGESLEKILARALPQYLSRFGLAHPILWFYSPAFVGAIPEVKDRSLIVYDCMDELSAFKGASEHLKQQERVLMSYADVVFTGGRSLYEAKQNYHNNVFCFPSSVDVSHFRKAWRGMAKLPLDVAAIPGPRVGFYGVLDERLNLELVRDIAQRMPHVSFIMIGPLAKISKEDLPQAPNIWYLGHKDYRWLPNYLKAMNVMFMPFALNEATRYISPTKTLEFLAAHKPVVSSPVPDVVRDFKDEVYIAKSPEGFKAAIEYYLKEPALDRQRRIRRQEAAVNRTSWDDTAAEMKRLMNEALRSKSA